MKDEYLEFLKDLVGGMKGYKLLSYSLFNCLYIYQPYDVDRFRDGLNMRYVFARKNGYSNEEVLEGLSGNCALLEMMVALSVKAADIVVDEEIGDQSPLIFMDMLKSSGLSDLTDDQFSDDLFSLRIRALTNQTYLPDGRNGWFYIPGECSMNRISIWDQLNKYLIRKYYTC